MIALTSALERSLIEHISSPASRAAAVRMSWSCSTGIAVICRSTNALLATNLSSHAYGCSAGASHREAVGVLLENFIQCADGSVHIFLLKYERRQEAKHRIAGAVDQYLPFQHFFHNQLRKICRIEFSRQH